MFLNFLGNYMQWHGPRFVLVCHHMKYISEVALLVASTVGAYWFMNHLLFDSMFLDQVKNF